MSQNLEVFRQLNRNIRKIENEATVHHLPLTIGEENHTTEETRGVIEIVMIDV